MGFHSTGGALRSFPLRLLSNHLPLQEEDHEKQRDLSTALNL
jgi:hypothetical protein